jgi:hypothetical protein
MVKVPSDKWCRICVTVSEQEHKIATYVDGTPVGVVEHECVSSSSGRFSMNPRGFLVFAAENSVSSPSARLRRVEVHKRAMTAEQVKEACRKHWILSDEVRALTCLSATERLKRLSLYGITKAVPIWKHPAFFGIFTDRYGPRIPCTAHFVRVHVCRAASCCTAESDAMASQIYTLLGYIAPNTRVCFRV